MKDEISRPKKHQQYSDELLYFTQSVIKMESEISHITQDQTTKNSGIRDPHFLPEVMSDTHEQLSELQRNVNFSSTKLKHEAPEANKKIIGAGFSDLKTDGRVSTSNLSENEMKTKGSEEITMPRKQVSDSPLWSPSDVTHTDNRGEIENGLCNISLSRVYFAQQAGGITDNRVILDGIQRTMNGPVLDRCNIRSNERKGARQWNKMTILNRKQSVLSSSANAFAKSSRIKGMFQNPAASGSKKQTGKRSFSDVEEYVYFLPENKETESTFNCGSSSKSESACKEHFPNKKHCKDERKKGEKTVVEDSVRHAEVVSRIQGKFVGKRKASLPSMKVVADSQGRIIVNVADAVEEKRNSFENSSNVPEIIVVEDDEEPQINTQDLGVNKRNFTGYRNYSPKRERAHLCTKHYFNLKTRQCSHNSALISNHSCWDSWRRANCVSDEENDTFENQKKHYHQMVTPINAFKEVKGTTNPMDLNNNSHALRFEPPHLNECIQTNRHPVPDKDIFRHAAVTMQDSRYSNRTDASYSENNQHSERFFGKPSTSVIKNHSRNCHVEEAISKDEEKICIYTDRQFVYSSYPREQDISYMNKTKSLMAEVSSGRTTCMYNIESTTKESQIQIQNNNTNPKSCGESDVREENAAILARRQHGDNRIKISSENADEGGYEDSETSSNMSPRDVPTMVGTTRPKVQYKVNAKVAGELPKEVYKRGEEVKTNLTKNSITELDGRYQCDWPACQKTFRHYSFLVLHKRIHTGERPYVCSWKGCNKQFRRSDDYQRHYRVHTGSKPYECVVCGKAFKRSDHRLFHYRAIHNMTDVKRGKKK